MVDRVWHHADGGRFQPAVYILASKPYGTLYVGVTSDLARRIFEHREGLVPGFTQRYGVKLLVYYEYFGIWRTPSSARNASRNGNGRGRSS